MARRARDCEPGDIANKRATQVGANSGHPGPAAYPPGFEVPDGWLDCPSIGHNLSKHRVIPCKVPLGNKFNPFIPPDKQFTPAKLIQQLAAKGYEVGLVIDLTNSWRYYHPDEFTELGVQHMKLQCRGRGETPEPEAVNHFCFQVLRFNQQQSAEAQLVGKSFKYQHIVVHCTHGFNRTGFMLVNFMVRMGMNTADACKTFAAHRQPGIYKDDYIQQLFSYNHEMRPSNVTTPPRPSWKQDDDEGDHSQIELREQDLGSSAEGLDLKHDDMIGESILSDEEEIVQQYVADAVTGQENALRRFPGSQPVSLARSNLDMLNARRYWVTWKADGTRFLLLICSWGSYLMDRSFRVRRLQMRFPLPNKKRHHNTLLDGEMVVDDNIETGTKTRRFLAYDMLLLNSQKLTSASFEERFKLIEEHVMKPRVKERLEMERDLHNKLRKLPFIYLYSEEPFRIRRKDFWPLPCTGKLLKDFIPGLSHESDGLIFQGVEDAYKVGTCEELLKWKFAHLNSVDFLLRINHSGGREIALMETRRSRGGGPSNFVTLPGGKIEISDEDAAELVDTVIECTWDKERKQWRFLRDRRDKDTPNAYHVYEKVVKSIEDDITEEVLLEAIERALQGTLYDKDKAALGIQRA